jgi:phosphate transport system substrate-binding protein
VIFPGIRGAVENIIAQEISDFGLELVEPTPAICSAVGIGQNECFPGTGAGIKMLIGNELDFSLSSRPLKSAERNMGLDEEAVAIDALVFVGNPDLDIDYLKEEEIKDIYVGSGPITWNKYGSIQDQEITSYSRIPGTSGTVDYFIETVLDEEQFGQDRVVYVGTTTKGIRNVAGNQGGIYFGSATEVVGQCKIRPFKIYNENLQMYIAPYDGTYVLPSQCPSRRNRLDVEAIRNKDYPLTRNLYVVFKVGDSRSRQVGKAYAQLLLTKQGQTAVQAAGYIKYRRD